MKQVVTQEFDPVESASILLSVLPNIYRIRNNRLAVQCAKIIIVKALESRRLKDHPAKWKLHVSRAELEKTLKIRKVDFGVRQLDDALDNLLDSGFIDHYDDPMGSKRYNLGSKLILPKRRPERTD